MTAPSTARCAGKPAGGSTTSALDGLSVIENYRAQFDHVIQRSSYPELVTRIDAKVSPAPAAAAGEPPTTSAAGPRTTQRLAPRGAESL